MNSKQRRKDSRLWKYNVTINAKSFGHYEEMWEWLCNRFGSKVSRCGWRDRHPEIDYRDYDDGTFDVVWQFVNERDAIEFTLRWA